MGKLKLALAALLTLVASAAAQQPSRVSNMPFASTPFNGSEFLYIVQGGASKKTNVTTFEALLTSVTANVTPFLGGTNNGVLYDAAGSIGALSAIPNGVMVTSGSGVPSISTTLPAGITVSGLPGLTTNVLSSTFPGLSLPASTPWMIYTNDADSGLLPSLYVIRDVGTAVPFSSYNPLDVSPTIMVQTNVDATAAQDVWPLLVQSKIANTVTGYCPINPVSGVSQCEHVNISSTLVRTGPSTGSNSPNTWTADWQSYDESGQADPTYSQIGQEIDYGSGPTVYGGTDSNGTRLGLQFLCEGNYSGTVNAGFLTIGYTYSIVSLGVVDEAQTDFTAIGAPINRIGIQFIATGVGSGTGTATTQATHCGRGITLGGYQTAVIDTGITFAGAFGRGIDFTLSSYGPFPSCQLCMAEGTVNGLTFGNGITGSLGGGSLNSLATLAGQTFQYRDGINYLLGTSYGGGSPVALLLGDYDFVQGTSGSGISMYESGASGNVGTGVIAAVGQGNTDYQQLQLLAADVVIPQIYMNTPINMPGILSITALTSSGLTATATVAIGTLRQNLNGQLVSITGASVSNYNVTNALVTITGTNTFTFPILSTTSSSATTATATFSFGKAQALQYYDTYATGNCGTLSGAVCAPLYYNFTNWSVNDQGSASAIMWLGEVCCGNGIATAGAGHGSSSLEVNNTHASLSDIYLGGGATYGGFNVATISTVSDGGWHQNVSTLVSGGGTVATATIPSVTASLSALTSPSPYSVATATMPSGILLTVGETVTIAGATNTGFNGNVVVATVTQDTFTYTCSCGAASAGGSPTVQYFQPINGEYVVVLGAGTANYNTFSGTISAVAWTPAASTGTFQYTCTSSNCGADNPSGSIYAEVDLGQVVPVGMTSAARGTSTYLTGVGGAELDLTVASGSSARYGGGYSVVLLSDNANELLSGIEPAFFFGAQAGAVPTITCGYCFGGPQGANPMTSTGSLIAWIPNVNSPAGTMTTGYGVDFRQITFNSFAIDSAGFTVDGSGNTVANTLKIAALPTSSPGSGGGFVCADSTGRTYTKVTCP